MQSGYSKYCSRSHHAVTRVYDSAGNVIETHEHKGDFQKMMSAEAWPGAAPHSFINSHNTGGARQPTPDALVPPVVTISVVVASV
jgi:hypothetical protein